MPDIYQQQRRRLIALNPLYATLLPETPPSAPPVAPIGLAAARRILGEAANNHGELVIVLGWGDGSLLRWIAEDPVLAQKEILVLLLRGEEDAFAASFRQDQVSWLGSGRIIMTVVRSEAEARQMASAFFGQHQTIPRLSGCDFVDGHPLCAAGEEARRELTPAILRHLSDRPQAYGNDISDSFTGLVNAAKNARAVLPAPTLEQLHGHYGDVPVISIAGGPSLNSQLPLLRELQDRALLVACDSVLKGLLAGGVDPHFVTPIERLPSTVDMVRGTEGCRAVFAGIAVVPPEAVTPFGERVVGVYAGDQIYTWMHPTVRRRISTGSSTGVLSFTVGSAFTTGTVYLVGHDLARDGDRSHWDGSPLSSELWLQAKQRSSSSTNAIAGLDARLVPGNGGGLVEATVWWDRFRSEIAGEVIDLKAQGRRVVNVSAHLRTGAVIPGTETAPLPDPASLPPLVARPLPARDPARLRDWQERAARLPADADAFLAHIDGLRAEIAAVRRLPPDRWPIDELSKKVSLTSGISPGNQAAFFYFLRSALHNSAAQWHVRRHRTASTARFRWEALDITDSLCHALGNAVRTLRPALEEIADDCRQP